MSPTPGERWTLVCCKHVACVRSKLGKRTCSHLDDAWNEMEKAASQCACVRHEVATLFAPAASWVNEADLACSPCEQLLVVKEAACPSRVLEPYGVLVDVFPTNPPNPSMEARRQLIEPYLIRSGFYYASRIKAFQYDNPD
ncbi:hypothetical protein PIB30_000485 [Stylosanthes scabra]|uniref:Uncharacterized protein n=1 Tax=Stylosanthes scabra TaxID=79078 RepID=A0ABU6W324_9FABA|nr:hypothetical protein [Stylosanthes scabra]